TLQIKLTCFEEELKKLQVSVSWIHGILKDHLGSHMNTEGKRSFVCVWQTSADVKAESLEKVKPELLANDLKKGWLQVSIDKLKTNNSKESRQNILGWLQESLKRLKEDSSRASRHTLAQWLKESVINLQKEGPEASRQDVNEWLDVSINHLQEKGPETSPLNVQEWLEASIKSIQDLQKSEAEFRDSLRNGWLEESIDNYSLRNGWLEESIDNLKKQYSEGPLENTLQWLQGSLESLLASGAPRPVLEKWLKDTFKNLEEGSPEASKQDAKKWLEISINNLVKEEPEAPHLDTQRWLETSIKGIQAFREQYSKASKANMEKSKERVIFVEPASSESCLRNEWLQASVANLQKHGSKASRMNVQQWLQGSLKNLRQGSPKEPRKNLEEWLKESIKKLQKEGPEASRQDVNEWLD
ncbi:uncharacterized protein LOC112543133, partial [Python bivittatus]|uniref:Uncharacterized protein LOC112543133 n=1 Tax=Python bivittatus TaxID=176946 RepID=A0A9F5IWY6_PYTBI